MSWDGSLFLKPPPVSIKIVNGWQSAQRGSGVDAIGVTAVWLGRCVTSAVNAAGGL